MDREQFLTLLTKKISNELSENEKLLLDETIDTHKEYAQIAKALSGYHASPELEQNYVNDKLKDTWMQIDNEPALLPAKKKLLIPALLRVAAMLILVAGIGIWLLNKKKTEPNLSIAQMDTIKTVDQKLYTTLDDGTQVTLNRNSAIIFNKEFGKEKRNITLKGEAFFDVTKNEKIRLVIEAGNIQIEVKGTAFNVNAYENRKETEVLLVRGLVEVSNKYNKSNKILLTPNQVLKAPVNKQTELAFNIITVDTIPAKNIALLSMDTLMFKKEKLKDLAKQLEKKYQVAIDIKNEALKDKRFSGMFAKETISEALEALKMSYPFSYKKSEDKIVIE